MVPQWVLPSLPSLLTSRFLRHFQKWNSLDLHENNFKTLPQQGCYKHLKVLLTILCNSPHTHLYFSLWICFFTSSPFDLFCFVFSNSKFSSFPKTIPSHAKNPTVNVSFHLIIFPINPWPRHKKSPSPLNSLNTSTALSLNLPIPASTIFI